MKKWWWVVISLAMLAMPAFGAADKAKPAEPKTVQIVGQTGVSEDKGCNPPRDDRSSDLCAQWKAADAAQIAAEAGVKTERWTLGALLVGAIGSLFGIVGSAAAIAAAFTVFRGERAWLTIDEISHSFAFSGYGQDQRVDSLKIRFTWTNTGKTPASNIVVRGGYGRAVKNGPPPAISTSLLERVPSIPVGGDKAFKPVKILALDYIGGKEKTYDIYVLCRVEYRDIFLPWIHHVSQVAYRLDGYDKRELEFEMVGSKILLR